MVVTVVGAFIHNVKVMDFIIAHGKIPEREAKRFFVQMISAVQYCHSKRCCHRDIKPENLLLDSNMNIKIIGTFIYGRCLACLHVCRFWIEQHIHPRDSFENVLWLSYICVTRVNITKSMKVCWSESRNICIGVLWTRCRYLEHGCSAVCSGVRLSTF